MLDNQTWDSVADQLVENDFYRSNHQLIFRVIKQLAKKQMSFDVITLSDTLRDMGELDNSGGLPYLIMLVEDTPTAANILAYTKIVQDRSVLRQLIHVSTEISNSVFNPEGLDTADLLKNAERLVFKITEPKQDNQGSLIPIKQLLGQFVETMEKLYSQEGSITGVSTGFTDFDNLTSGLQPSDLIIVASRPSMGKSSIAMNMAENVALKSDKTVLVFSMEMPREALTIRLMSSLGHIEQHKVRMSNLEDDDWPRLTSAISLLANTKLFIDDTRALSLTELRTKARRVAHEHGQLGLIVVDYLQLIQSPNNDNDSVQQVSDISKGLKVLAKELNVPIVALSQLNRNLEQRPNKRPVLSDLHHSGAIEEDADLIVFVYRDEIYNPESPDKGIAELIIAKQRNGRLGTVRLNFLGQYSRFENFSDTYHHDKDEYFN